jgi:hypothetical protein
MKACTNAGSTLIFKMNPRLYTVSLRAAAVRQVSQLLDGNTPLHQSQYMTWLRYEVLAVYQDTGSAIIAGLELASPGDGIALMNSFEQILSIVTQNHPDLSVVPPVA